MKIRLFVIALLVAVAGFSACKKDKSKECDMLSVSIGTATFDKTVTANGGSFSYQYPKVCDGIDNAPSGAVRANITISPKAICKPDKDGSYNFANEQTFVVTAQDGKTSKTYRIQYTKNTTAPCP